MGNNFRIIIVTFTLYTKDTIYNTVVIVLVMHRNHVEVKDVNIKVTNKLQFLSFLASVYTI